MKDFKFDKNFNVYEEKYDYDFVKAFSIISAKESELDYEDLFIITQACYEMWQTQISGYFKQFPWMEYENDKERGYIQSYAERTAQDWIELFKQTNFYY